MFDSHYCTERPPNCEHQGKPQILNLWLSEYHSGREGIPIKIKIYGRYYATKRDYFFQISYVNLYFIYEFGPICLRVGAIHDAKFHQNLLIHDVSKIRHPGGWAEIKDVTWCIIYLFNFSSARRGHFSNVSTLFYISGPFVKNMNLRFFSLKNIEQNVKDSCFGTSCMAPILKVIRGQILPVCFTSIKMTPKIPIRYNNVLLVSHSTWSHHQPYDLVTTPSLLLTLIPASVLGPRMYSYCSMFKVKVNPNPAPVLLVVKWSFSSVDPTVKVTHWPRSVCADLYCPLLQVLPCHWHLKILIFV